MVKNRFSVLKGFVIFTLKLRSESVSRFEQTVLGENLQVSPGQGHCYFGLGNPFEGDDSGASEMTTKIRG